MQEKIKKKIEILELGTGSGAVIISLVIELKNQGVQVNASATDICSKALSVAQNNSRWLGTDISFSHGNWFENFKLQKKKFDLIIINPPYVGLSHSKFISDEIYFEPKLALYGLDPSFDGLNDYKTIINGLQNNTKNESILIMEHGSMQKTQIRKLLKSNGFTNLEEINDLAGLPRIVKVRL